MDLMCGGTNNSNGCHLAVFSKDVALAVATHSPPTLSPGRGASGIDYTSRNYLKWQAIQLPKHSTVVA